MYFLSLKICSSSCLNKIYIKKNLSLLLISKYHFVIKFCICFSCFCVRLFEMTLVQKVWSFCGNSLICIFVICVCVCVCTYGIIWASLVAQLVKILPKCKRSWFDSWVGKIPWRREQLPTSVFFPGEYHGWRNLEVHSVHGFTKSLT